MACRYILVFTKFNHKGYFRFLPIYIFPKFVFFSITQTIQLLVDKDNLVQSQLIELYEKDEQITEQAGEIETLQQVCVSTDIILEMEVFMCFNLPYIKCGFDFFALLYSYFMWF